jgi:hypothetical protein
MEMGGHGHVVSPGSREFPLTWTPCREMKLAPSAAPLRELLGTIRELVPLDERDKSVCVSHVMMKAERIRVGFAKSLNVKGPTNRVLQGSSRAGQKQTNEDKGNPCLITFCNVLVLAFTPCHR